MEETELSFSRSGGWALLSRPGLPRLYRHKCYATSQTSRYHLHQRRDNISTGRLKKFILSLVVYPLAPIPPSHGMARGVCNPVSLDSMLSQGIFLGLKLPIMYRVLHTSILGRRFCSPLR